MSPMATQRRSVSIVIVSSTRGSVYAARRTQEAGGGGREVADARPDAMSPTRNMAAATLAAHAFARPKRPRRRHAREGPPDQPRRPPLWHLRRDRRGSGGRALVLPRGRRRRH